MTRAAHQPAPEPGTAAGRPVPLAAGDPFARAARAAWRRLTGGRGVRDGHRRTLLACSGGADSSALVLALAGVRPAPVVAHIVHDLRPEPEAIGDRDSARELARALGLEFVEARVDVCEEPGNAEANARGARYSALESLARACGTAYIATGHHGDDQLETVLMRLLRGAGPGGLAGIPGSRVLGAVTLVRPLLGVPRAMCLDACRRAGWRWREDSTNEDTGRLRAALRASVTPTLRALAPGLPGRLVRTSALLADAQAIIEARVEDLLARGEVSEGGRAWDRGALAAEPGAVIGGVVRASLSQAGVGADDLGGVRVEPVVNVIRGGVDARRTFVFGPARVIVTGSRVEIGAAAPERSHVHER